MEFVIHMVVTAIALMVVSRLLRGVEVDSWFTALVAALILGLVHAFMAPLADRVGRAVGETLARTQFAYPVKMGLLILSMLLINAVVLRLAAALGPGFRVRGWGTAIVGALLIVLCNSLIGAGIEFVQAQLGAAPVLPA